LASTAGPDIAVLNYRGLWHGEAALSKSLALLVRFIAEIGENLATHATIFSAAQRLATVDSRHNQRWRQETQGKEKTAKNRKSAIQPHAKGNLPKTEVEIGAFATTLSSVSSFHLTLSGGMN
jgi:hypothetical protein